MRRAPVLLFGVLAWFALLPSPSRWFTDLPGQRTERALFAEAWRAMLRAGEWGAHADGVYFPAGMDRWSVIPTGVVELLTVAAAQVLFGAALGFGLAVLAAFAASGWLGSHALVRLGVSPESASLAAVLAAFNPWSLAMAADGRLVASMVGLPALIVATLAAPTRPKGWMLAGLGLLVADSAPVNAVLAFAIGGIAAFRSGHSPAALAAGLPALAWLLLGPAHHAATLDVENWSFVAWSPVASTGEVGELSTWSGLDGSAGAWTLLDGALTHADRVVATSLLHFALLGAASLIRGGHRSLIVILSLVGLWAAGGPDLGGVPNPPWIALAKTVGIVDRVWTPSDALIVAHAGVALAAGAVLAQFGHRWRTRLAVVAALATAGLVQGNEAGTLPIGSWRLGGGSALECLAEADTGALLTLPLGQSGELAGLPVHGRPVVGGPSLDGLALGRSNEEALLQNSLVAAADGIAAGEPAPVSVTRQDREALAAAGFRWIYVPRGANGEKGRASVLAGPTGPAARQALDRLLGDPVYDDSDGVLWAPWGDDSPCGRSRAEAAEGPSKAAPPMAGPPKNPQ